ncbi:uncharacterized protein [Watersipora subatra]|uniref:uncharacterized protein n=1 Tax=Watersipora subatra TaxID=2589382 RepID=UPI00355B2141
MMMQIEYPIDKSAKGLFVIVRQQTHQLNFHPLSPKNECDWGLKSELKYAADEERIKKVFAWNFPQDESEWLIRLNLENSEADPKNHLTCFDSFMEYVCRNDRATPKFILFFLLSHGFENGVFLLAAKGVTINGQRIPKMQCCSGEDTHRLVDKCFARSISRDIICKLSKRYPDIPKLCVIQTCRGGAEENLQGSVSPPPTIRPSATELFIADQSDTLVFRASVESYKAYVENGSLLIKSFCDAVSELQQNCRSYHNLLKTIGKNNPCLESYLRDHREDLIGGWAMNICQRATALVTNRLLVTITLSDTSLGRLLLALDQGDSETAAKIHEEFREGITACDIPAESKQTLLDACSRRPEFTWLICRYLSGKIILLKPAKLLNELQPFRLHLDKVITALHNKVPFAKQQPHISSSLGKKLSIIKIIGTRGQVLT